MKVSRRAHARATRNAVGSAAALVAVAMLVPPCFGAFFYGTDLTRINLAMMCAIRERLAAGGPLGLSPLLGNGGPLLARPDASLFYPPRWLAVALPPDWGVAVEVALHLAIAAGATAWLLRTLGVRPFTAAAAGITFAFSGTALDLLRHAHYLVAAAWLPVIWAGARVALRGRTRTGVLAIFAGAAGCLLGAEPQAFAVGAGLVAIEVAVHWRTGHRPRWAWASLGAALGCGFLVGLLQWAPALGEMALTPRKASLPLTEALAWSLTPSQWVGVVLPGMPSQYVQGVTTLGRVIANDAQAAVPWNKTPYLGALLVAAAACGVTARRGRAAAIVAAGATIFALGDRLPVLPLLMKLVPALARFRYPSKYWLVASLALIVLAAIALDRIHRARARRRLVIAASLAAGLLALGLGAVAVWSDALNARALAVGVPAGDDVLPTLSEALTRALLHAGGIAALAALMAGQARLRRFCAALIAIDVVAAAPFALMAGPPLADVPKPDAIAAGAVLCVHPALAGRFFPQSGLGLDRSTALHLRTHLVPELQACGGIAAGIVYSPLESSAGASLGVGAGAMHASALRAFGCTQVLALAPLAGADARPFVVTAPGLDGPFSEATVSDVPDAVLSAFVSASPVLARDEAAALVAVAAARTRDALLQVVDDPLGHLAGAGLPSGEGVTVASARSELTERTLTVSGPAVVGVRAPYLVGWRAELDGQPLPTVRLAAHLLGVVAPRAGTLVLRYAPPNQVPGGLAALLGSLGLAGLMAANWPRRRRQ